jgi:uncharacterized protein (TIGR03437 family)
VRILFSFLVAVAVCAQAPTASPKLQGDYSFVELEVRRSGQRVEAKNLGGLIRFDANGRYFLRAEEGIGAALAKSVERAGSLAGEEAGGLWTLDNPADPKSKLAIYCSPDFNILIGANQPGAGFHSIFVAVRSPEGEPPALQGGYAGGYLTLRGGRPEGLFTALLQFEADGQNGVRGASGIGHEASIDDVTRVYELGSGTAVRDQKGLLLRFPSPAGPLPAEFRALVSRDAEVVLAYSVSAENRDILVMARRTTEAATVTFRGVFHTAEMWAENSFAFRPETARFGSALGGVRSEGDGVAVLSQWVDSSGRPSHLTTTNRVLVGTDRQAYLSARPQLGLNNLVYGANLRMFVAANVGLEKELTLEHGLMIGLAAGEGGGAPVYLFPTRVTNAATLAPPPSPAAPNTLFSLFGVGLAPSAANADRVRPPFELGGVKVLVNGNPVALLTVSPDRIDCVMPENLTGVSATVQVNNNGQLSNVVRIPVARTSPGIFTVEQKGYGRAVAHHADNSPVNDSKPAAPGKTLVLFGAGFGDSKGLRVLIGGKEARIESAGLARGRPGVYEIKVRVPDDAPDGASVPVAAVTSDSLTDLVEIPVRR